LRTFRRRFAFASVWKRRRRFAATVVMKKVRISCGERVKGRG
jgi:hypothetical protein